MTSQALSDPILERVTRTIAESLKPRRIILFGSRARGNAHSESDYDLMIEMETSLSPWDRGTAVDRLFGLRNWSMDVFVFTPAEVRRFRSQVGSIVHTAEREGTALYEQD